jgi:hypothetical protein
MVLLLLLVIEQFSGIDCEFDVVEIRSTRSGVAKLPSNLDGSCVAAASSDSDRVPVVKVRRLPCFIHVAFMVCTRTRTRNITTP